MPDAPDLAFTATVRANELRFRSPPDTDVRFWGTPGSKSTRESSRTNLPDPVPAGVTHRDVRIAYVMANRLLADVPREEPEGED